MDPHRSPFSLRLFKDLYERLPTIQKRDPKAKPDPQKIKIFRGLTLVFCAVLFGWASLSATEHSSIARYRLQTWPQKSIWESSLRERGFAARGNLGDYSRQIQTHPDAFSGKSTIWISADGCIIYLPSSPFRDRSSELWTCNVNPSPPHQWLQAGSGLDGFEKLIAFVDKNPKKSTSPARPRLKPIDPKEIRY